MIFTFDYSGRYEYPVMEIANPDFEQLYILEQTKGLVITPRFNAVSELEFTVYQKYNNIILPYYDVVCKNRLIHVEGFGWWIIDTTTEINDGGVPYKNVHCYSYEYTINYKGINLLNGTYKFYDLISPKDTLMYKLMAVLPNWTLGNVDSDLLNLYRTFDVPDATLYGFLMDEVSTTYEVIFEFDTENLVINAYSPKNVVKNTDIVCTFDNMNKEISVEELTTDIYTVLRVNGAENLSINVVNPLGDNKLYNFDYYNNESWIKDQNLREKIKRWQIEVENQREPYSKILQTLNSQNRDLLRLKAELVDLNSELNALEIVRKNLTDQPQEFKKKTDEVDAKNVEISNKEKEISTKEKQIETTKSQLKSINDLVRFDSYFTEQERLILDPYIIESVYTDENFIVTDQMKLNPDSNGETTILTTTGLKKIKDLTDSDIIIDEQYIANQLLEQGRSVLDKISQPSFTFELSSVNFLFMQIFMPFIQQIQLGCLINVEIKEDDWVYPILLEMVLDYDNPTSFSMTFGNRFRLNTGEWTFADLHNETSKVSSQVGSTLGVIAEPVLNGTVNELSEYMNNSLIAANQLIQSTTDNEVTMGGFGLRLRKKDSSFSTGYDPHQTWLNNNLICMTDNNWQSVKLAIGFIQHPEKPSESYYGVNAEVIAGNLLAGNQLIISDKNSTFIVDSNGARLTNASFVLETADKKGKIILNPQQGIKIQTDKGAGLKDNFYVDQNGRLMATDITATGGTIGGFTITQNSLKSANGNVLLNDNGTGKLGLLTWNLTSATFDGNIYAKNLNSGGFGEDIVIDKFEDLSIPDRKIKNLNANKLFGGPISGINISGGVISDATIDGSCWISSDALEVSNIPLTALDFSRGEIPLESLADGPWYRRTATWRFITSIYTDTITDASGRSIEVVTGIDYDDYKHDYIGGYD